jgi:myo-inositol-1(or 4)-monophosphatase
MRDTTKMALRGILIESSQRLVDKEVLRQKNEIATVKGKHDYATKVDKLSENLILQRLRESPALFPYVVVSEESEQPLLLGDEGELLLDPLEGTDNYRYGRHPFGINIGVVEKGALVYAVFCDASESPLQIIEAEKGRGTFLYVGEFKNGQKLHVEPDNRHVAFNQWEDVDELTIGGYYARLLKFTRRVSTTYSDSGDLCGVALGKYGGAVFVYEGKDAKPWDMVMALAVEEAGGVVTDFLGDRWDSYDNQGMLLVRNGMLAAGKPIYDSLKACLA